MSGDTGVDNIWETKKTTMTTTATLLNATLSDYSGK